MLGTIKEKTHSSLQSSRKPQRPRDDSTGVESGFSSLPDNDSHIFIAARPSLAVIVAAVLTARRRE